MEFGNACLFLQLNKFSDPKYNHQDLNCQMQSTTPPLLLLTHVDSTARYKGME